MNDLAHEKNELENNVFPLIQRKRKRHGFTKEKKKKLSHENERRLIEHHHQTIEDKSEVGGPQTALNE